MSDHRAELRRIRVRREQAQVLLRDVSRDTHAAVHAARADGLTVVEIADLLGLSRQAVHTVLRISR
jgi:DNA-directed RNA polymerase specialized sigma24 family protein